MDNWWAWFLGSLVLVVLAVILLPKIQRTAVRKDFPASEPKEEIAEAIAFIPKTPTERKQKEEEPDPYIPHYYGVDRLVLSIKDPNWLHAYWEITDENRKRFIREYGPEAWYSSRLVLRLYDVSGLHSLENLSFCSFREILLEPFTDNWFIEVGQPDRSFYCEIGIMLVDGRFITLLRSNMVTTPRASVSDKVDEEWMWIEGIYRSLGRISFGLSSAALVEHVNEVNGVLPLGVSSPGMEK